MTQHNVFACGPDNDLLPEKHSRWFWFSTSLDAEARLMGILGSLLVARSLPKVRFYFSLQLLMFNISVMKINGWHVKADYWGYWWYWAGKVFKHA